MLRIAIGQINPTVGDLKGNSKKVLDGVEKAKDVQADIVVFPETAICGYPPEDLLLKDHFIDDQMKILRACAKKIRSRTAVIGFVDSDKQGNLYNAAAVINGGVIRGIYRKQELPNYGVFDEKRYFLTGENEKIYSLDKCLFGVNICEDIWVDNSVYAKQCAMGAKLLINISSSPYDMRKLRTREKLLIKRAKETGAYICYANLVGGQDELVFDGGSMIIDPTGQVISFGKQFKEDFIAADVDVPQKNVLLKSRNVIAFNRPARRVKKILLKEREHYFTENESIYRALVLGTHDYVIKNGFKKVIIGLSGGIDSALVASIAVDALGKDNVVGVSMPSKYTSKATRSDSKHLAENLGIEFKEIPINDAVKAYDKLLKSSFEGLKENIAEENIQARIRGNILMALSNKFGWLVLTTGNKSELAVGYCTLYGDMTGGFAVINDVPKTKVYELAMFRNEHGDRIIPRSIIDRAPSAELKPNQTDQDSLPPYDVLDNIIQGYVEEHLSLKKLSKKTKLATIKKVIKLVDNNEYKRRQAPPGIKITSRAFGKDWRVPITNKYKEF